MIKFNTKLYFSIFLLVIGIAFTIMSEVLYKNRTVEINVDNLVDDFRNSFLSNYENAVNSLDYLIDNFEYDEDKIYTDLGLIETLQLYYEKHGFKYVVIENEEIIFWSNNNLNFYGSYHHNEYNNSLIKLLNGWYFFERKEVDNLDFYVFMLIKRDYNYQNKYLSNTYFEDYKMLGEQIYPSISPTDYYLLDEDEENVLVYLSADNNATIDQKSPALFYFSIFSVIIGYFLIFYSIYIFYSYMENHKRFLLSPILIFILLFISARIIIYFVGVPAPFSDSDLFSPSLYATSYFLPSLGDLLFNVLLLLVLTWIINQKINFNYSIKINSNWKKYVICFLITILISISAYFSFNLIEGLVINSRLNLNVNFVLSLDYFSIIGFLIIGCILFTFYFFTKILIAYLKSIIPQKRDLSIAFLISVFVFYVLLIIFQISYNILILICLSLISFQIIYEKSSHRKLNFNKMFLYVFVFSLVSTAVLFHFNKIKEKDERKSLAIKLSSEQDHIAEYLFAEKQNNLLWDNNMREIIYNDPYDEHGVYNYLRNKYFHDYWLKYDIQITVCQPDEILLIKPANVEMQCGYFFNNYIDSYGKETVSNYLFFLNNNTGRDSYIARIPVFFEEDSIARYPDTTPDYYLFVEFDSKYIPRDMGFPELLIDESVDINRELVNYSFAFYKFGELTHRVGNYYFNNNSETYGEFDKEFTFFESDNYHHLNYNKDHDTQIIISRKKEGFFEIIAPFSYLFVLFFLMVLLFWLISAIKSRELKFQLNFKRRLQFFMVIIVILSVITIGWASMWFLFDIHENKSLDNLSEKAHSILVELEHDLGDEEYLDHSYQNYLSDYLLKLSNVFFTDIILYDSNGNLISSSRSRIFDEGLVSTFMQPYAYNIIKKQNKSFFVHEEQIGYLEYLSAYIPLKNYNNQLLAYVNLPYFARESEIRYEVSTFLVTFLNIYLLLFLMAIALAFIISNYVTLPLQQIKENLSGIKLGGKNKKIDWYNRNDEIGSLVREYNRMIDELEISAELLAKNERESAWREMAKQVAHEIKNPLTPMKLSVQYLNKAWKDKVSDWDQRLEGFSKTMIEQIDSLSLIAGEFSDFAKLPSKNNNDQVNLNKFIPEITELYKDIDKVCIELNVHNDNVKVFVDSKQMVRVFNNLIKNAIQSYRKDETAYVIIDCYKKEKEAVINFKDKGCGIPDSKKIKIFKPYFTTKTGGVGLGLAMVKGIIDGFGGSVTFESKENIGSSFIITLPLINDDD